MVRVWTSNPFARWGAVTAGRWRLSRLRRASRISSFVILLGRGMTGVHTFVRRLVMSERQTPKPDFGFCTSGVYVPGCCTGNNENRTGTRHPADPRGSRYPVHFVVAMDDLPRQEIVLEDSGILNHHGPTSERTCLIGTGVCPLVRVSRETVEDPRSGVTDRQFRCATRRRQGVRP